MIGGNSLKKRVCSHIGYMEKGRINVYPSEGHLSEGAETVVTRSRKLSIRSNI